MAFCAAGLDAGSSDLEGEEVIGRRWLPRVVEAAAPGGAQIVSGAATPGLECCLCRGIADMRMAEPQANGRRKKPLPTPGVESLGGNVDFKVSDCQLSPSSPT